VWGVAREEDFVGAIKELFRALGYSEPEDEAAADGRSCYEQISPSLVKVNRLLKQRDDAVHLLGDILATLQLPGNQELPIARLGVSVLPGWKAQFEKASGEP